MIAVHFDPRNKRWLQRDGVCLILHVKHKINVATNHKLAGGAWPKVLKIPPFAAQLRNP